MSENKSDNNGKDSSIQSDELKAYIDLFKHWDTGFWTAVQMFLIAEGLLFTAFFAARQIAEAATFPFGPVVVALAGFALAGIWAVVLARKRTYVVGAENLLRHRLPGLYRDTPQPDTPGTITAEQDRCARVWSVDHLGSWSSAPAVKFWLPVVIGVLWLLLGITVVCVGGNAPSSTGAQSTSAPLVSVPTEEQPSLPEGEVPNDVEPAPASAPLVSVPTKEQRPLPEGEVPNDVESALEPGPEDDAPKFKTESPPGVQEPSK